VRCERGGAPGQDVAGGGAWEGGGGEAGRAGLKTGIHTNNIHTSEGGPLQMLLTLTPAVMSQKFGC
jgi:hypothetical protein